MYKQKKDETMHDMRLLGSSRNENRSHLILFFLFFFFSYFLFYFIFLCILAFNQLNELNLTGFLFCLPIYNVILFISIYLHFFLICVSSFMFINQVRNKRSFFICQKKEVNFDTLLH